MNSLILACAALLIGYALGYKHASIVHKIIAKKKARELWASILHTSETGE